MDDQKQTADEQKVVGSPSQRYNEDVEKFIQRRAYYYLALWPKIDHTLKTVEGNKFNWAAFFLNGCWMMYRKM